MAGLKNLFYIVACLSAPLAVAGEGTDLIGKTLPETEQQVTHLLERIDARLAQNDGARWFNFLYINTTRNILAATDAGRFENEAFMRRFVVTFANLYFKALSQHLDRKPLDSDSWMPLFKRRFESQYTPIQFALAGLIAHISHDLPVALELASRLYAVDLVVDSAEHRDFLKINEILRMTWLEIKEKYQEICQTNGGRSTLCGIDDEAVNHLMTGMRDKAFIDARTLVKNRNSIEDRRATLKYLDVMTIALARSAFLAPGLRLPDLRLKDEID